MKVQEQLRHLEPFPAFTHSVSTHLPEGLNSHFPEIFQLNLGKWCNQSCQHCHVDASPRRTETMSAEIASLCMDWIEKLPSVHTVDLTGGAPEGCPQFKEIVLRARNAGKKVIDRCNLTILSEPGFEWLAEFLAENQVEVVSSLPSFSPLRTNKQRGNGVFERSIAGLQKLNSLGYGKKLPLHLVYNPSGIFLSGSQSELEREFKSQLFSKYEITFNNLFCINNMPISRFLESLLRTDKLELYMETLIQAFNPATLQGLMCKNQISISWDGRLYDCDFNQMLDLPCNGVQHIKDFKELQHNRKIRLHNHCYGCTAGAGSSCGGEIT